MSAALELQAALVAALAAAPGIVGVATGVWELVPPRQPFPYLALGDAQSVDWSTKTERGREHRVSVVAWDEAGQGGRLRGLAGAIEDALDALAPALPTNRIVSTAMLRTRVLRPAAGPWAAQVDYRLRTQQL